MAQVKPLLGNPAPHMGMPVSAPAVLLSKLPADGKAMNVDSSH